MHVVHAGNEKLLPCTRWLGVAAGRGFQGSACVGRASIFVCCRAVRLVLRCERLISLTHLFVTIVALFRSGRPLVLDGCFCVSPCVFSFTCLAVGLFSCSVVVFVFATYLGYWRVWFVALLLLLLPLLCGFVVRRTLCCSAINAVSLVTAYTVSICFNSAVYFTGNLVVLDGGMTGGCRVENATCLPDPFPLS